MNVNVKRLIMTVWAGCVIGAACAQQHYTITGNIDGVPDGTVLQITPMSHEKDQPLDSATVSQGRYAFSGTVAEPICVRLGVKDAYGTDYVMLDNRVISITSRVTKNVARDGRESYRWQSEVSNSPLTDSLNVFRAKRRSLDSLFQAMRNQYRDLYDRMAQAQGDEREKIRQSDEYKAMEVADGQFMHYTDSVINQMVIDHRDSFWGPLLAVYSLVYFTPQHRELYNQFSDEAKNSFYGRRMHTELWPGGEEGDTIPLFTVSDDEGNAFSFKQLAQGKRHLLIDFWASWCGPCRKEIPNVKRQYELYKDKGFEVVSISIDKNPEAWKKALNEEQLPWPNFRSTEVADLFHVKAIPAMFLVDANGTIIAETDGARGEKLAQKLAELNSKIVK